jgi:ferredoxin
VFCLKANVDKDTCISCGLCPSICPEVFEMQDDGKAGTIEEKVPEQVQESAEEAEDACPVNAISIE